MVYQIIQSSPLTEDRTMHGKRIVNKKGLVAFAATLLLAGLSLTVQAACTNIPACNLNTSWNHINQRHCNGCVVGDRSEFNSNHCANQAAMTQLCDAIRQAGTCAETAQPPNRIKATATLANNLGRTRDAGCPATATGSVIY
ncbi:MAG: hypothetical protein QNJ82_12775, partial [Gammaproteobacteria bacterium]|nr:hypothetical protein [Gammaproteobacteria bacterium]